MSQAVLLPLSLRLLFLPVEPDLLGATFSVMIRHLALAQIPTLFVTHYPLLSRLANEQPGVANYHMAFLEEETAEGCDEIADVTSGSSTDLSESRMCAAASATASRRVLFLYKLVRGTAHSSFGLNVARLAELPASVVDAAAIQASNLQAWTAARSYEAARRLLGQLAKALRTDAIPSEELSALVSASARIVEDMQAGSQSRQDE
eukprot:COSAG02_NODE_8049_length_2732_cov_1.665401_2_plen_205_part_00